MPPPPRRASSDASNRERLARLAKDNDVSLAPPSKSSSRESSSSSSQAFSQVPQAPSHSTYPTRVLCWGSSSHNTLGPPPPGLKRHVYPEPTPAPHPPAMKQRNSATFMTPNSLIPSSDSPLKVFAGHRITTVVTDSGRVYSWGFKSPSVDTLGHTARGAGYLKCGPIQSVSHCFPGGGGGSAQDEDRPTYAIAITNKDELYGWGKGGGGRMGSNTKAGAISIPAADSGRSIKCGIKSVATGGSFTLVVTSDGTLFASGNNDACQLGLSDTAPRRNFVPLPFAAVSFTTVAAGVNHAGAVTASGELYTWGWGENGRLGLGDDNKRAEPTLVEALKDDLVFVTDVSFGSAHSCVLNDQGDVYCWGWNLYGQCGVPNDEPIGALDGAFSATNAQCKNPSDQPVTDILLPRLALPDEVVTSLSAGFAHTAAVSAVGMLFTWGFGEEGQLGHGVESNEFEPRQVSFDATEGNLRCLSVACGHTHTAAVVSKLSSVQNDDRRMEGAKKRAAAGVLLKFFRSSLVKVLLHKKYKPVLKVKAVKKAACVVAEAVEDEVDHEEVERMKIALRREEEDRKRRELEERAAAERLRREAAEEVERERLRMEEEEEERLRLEAEERERLRLKTLDDERKQRKLEEKKRRELEEKKRKESEEIVRFNENEAMRIAEEEQRLMMATRRASMLALKAKRDEREKTKAEDMLRKEVKRLRDAKKAADRLKKGREKKEKAMPTVKRSSSASGLRGDNDMADRLKAMAAEKKQKEEKEERERERREEKEEREKARKEKEREKMVAKRDERLREEREKKDEDERAEREEWKERREEEERAERERREEEGRIREESERRLKELKGKMGKKWEPPPTQYLQDDAESGPDLGGMGGAGGFKSASNWGRKLSKSAPTGIENRRGGK